MSVSFYISLSLSFYPLSLSLSLSLSFPPPVCFRYNWFQVCVNQPLSRSLPMAARVFSPRATARPGNLTRQLTYLVRSPDLQISRSHWVSRLSKWTRLPPCLPPSSHGHGYLSPHLISTVQQFTQKTPNCNVRHIIHISDIRSTTTCTVLFKKAWKQQAIQALACHKCLEDRIYKMSSRCSLSYTTAILLTK